MGRGSSGAKGSGGGWKAEKSAIGSDGQSIDLTDSPLRYSEDDKTVTGPIRDKIEQFEKNRVKNKIEYSRIVDANGNIIEERKGGNGSVRSTIRAMNAADTFSHNHPREAGGIGGTFSVADINNFSNYGVRVFRAATNEGTYSIRKEKGFDSNGLKNYYKSVERQAQKDHADRVAQERQKYNDVVSAWRNGTATQEQATKAYYAYEAAKQKSFNRCLVDLHNGLISGQKQYGYYYTLERRRK